jgi:hypothetical protein
VFAAILLAVVLAVLFQAAVGSVLTAIELSRGTLPSQLQEAILERLATPYMFMLMLGAGQLGFAIATLIPATRFASRHRCRLAARFLVRIPGVAQQVDLADDLVPLLRQQWVECMANGRQVWRTVRICAEFSLRRSR